ncbi:MAG: tape measure protein [Thauera sp.]|jgi:tape measure domain-containing protein|nr:tape measure protein [Thauera sp.]
MALVDSQEVSLAISAQTTGTAGVSELASQLGALARSGGEVSPEIARIAQEVQRLGQQQVSINGLEQAIAAGKETWQTLSQARHEVQVLDKALADARGAGASAEAIRLLDKELRTANAQLSSAERAWTKQKAVLAAARAEAAGMGIDTRNVGAAQQKLATDIAAANAKIQTASAATGRSLKDAFADVGVRSGAAIQAEISRINQSMQRLATDARVSSADFDRAWAAAQQRIAQLRAEGAGAMDPFGASVDRTTDKLNTGLGKISAAVGGLFALSRLPGLAADLGQTADLYANLGARIDLVNSSQAGFNLTLDDTARLARATHTGLDATTSLLAALSRAGEEVGLAQQDTLRLTETINKANQVAGQSATAADAAIVQLIQGLQSGVLRGEEFNSIMEQSPRLARALADGLDVPLGSLRALAKEGKLTSEVVIKALQSQAAAIDEEFSKLPLTIGRSMTDLSTNWTMFLGELDKTTGASTRVAEAIGLVANNLDTIASAASLAGQAALAALAVKAAGAAKAYTAQLVVATGATTTLGAASTALGATIARLAPILRTMGWMGIALEIGSIGSNLLALRDEYKKHGEIAAATAEKQAQIRDRLAEISAQVGITISSMAELDAAVGAGQIHFDEATASWQAGSAALGGAASGAASLSLEAQALVDKFAALTAEGKNVEDAVKAMLATFDPKNHVGVQALAQSLTELQTQGKLSAEQVRSAWEEAIKDLTGDELAQFGQTVSTVMQNAGADAQMLATALDVQLRSALKTLGIDAEQSMTGMSQVFLNAANSLGVITQQFDLLRERGVAASAMVQEGIDKMLAVASSPAELQGLIVLVEDLGRKGQLSGEQVAAALGKIKTKSDEITPGINSAAEALKQLGITSDTELKKAAESARRAYEAVREFGGSAREQEQAFRTMAQAAIEANGGVASAALKAQAAQHGLRIEADETGKNVVRSMDEAAEATKKLGESAEEASTKFAVIGESAEDAGEAVKEAGEDSVAMTEEMRSAAEIVGDFTGRTQRQWIAYSEQIADATRRIAGAAEQAERALAALDAQQRRLNSSAADGVEDLKLRLLELSGTEDEIAEAREERDKAQIRRQIEMMKLDIERAKVRGDFDEAARLREEIKLLEQQITLVGKLYDEEEKARKRRQREDGGSGGGSGGGGMSSGSGTGGGSAAPGGGIQTGSPTMQSISSVRMEITLGKHVANVTTDRAGADALTELLKTLETDSLRT